MFRIIGIAAVIALGAPGQAQHVAGFTPRMFTIGADRMPYRLFIPGEIARRQPLPLVVWLHGAGGAGTDNSSQISAGGNDQGSRLWVRPDVQAKFPAFVVAPQTAPGKTWGDPAFARLTPAGALVMNLIEALAQEFAIDRDRVYILGQSLGGIGVWDLISKRPDVFAAAVPLCGRGDPKRIVAAAHVKVWAFHGAADTGMPVANTRAMVAALKASGAIVKYTEYPGVAHDVWTRAFKEPDLPAWLFAQKRTQGDCAGLCR